VQSESREYFSTNIFSILRLNILVCLKEFQFNSLIGSLKMRTIVSSICSISSGKPGIDVVSAVALKAIKGRPGFICGVKTVAMMNR
jgi:hypothetical protein